MIILMMDDIFRQQHSANAWDRINMRGHQPPRPDDALSSSSSSISSDDQNDMDLDDGFSGGFGHLFEEQC